MHSPVLGLHHVTATVGDAQADLDFGVDALGLRLVKKTVNFDNHFVYHFYYGDEIGHPGTIWTMLITDPSGLGIELIANDRDTRAPWTAGSVDAESAVRGLFEIATVAPGFPVDEPVADLGRGLKLPPWEEPNRAEIEARLPSVRY